MNKIKDPEAVALGAVLSMEKTEKQREIAQKIKATYQKESSEREKLEQKMFAIQVRMESYLEKDEAITVIPLAFFIKNYLDVFQLSQAKMAKFLEIPASNFSKYLRGESKFNIVLAIKLAKAFNLPVKLLLQIQLKNELAQITKNSKENFDNYSFNELLSVS